MTIHIASRRCKRETIEKRHPGSAIYDVTSKGAEPWIRFSPFYPHGGIPVPGMDRKAQSVEGVWQGLKVFATEGIDESKFDITNMKGIKRSVRTRGRVLGHRFGEELLSYRDARVLIYLPTYQFMLNEFMSDELSTLRKAGDVVLLDYETNVDIDDVSKPLSHASLIAAYLGE